MPDPSRGGSGNAPGEGIEFMAYAEMEPDVLVSGLLTIMVRNIDIDNPINGEPQDDIVSRMHEDWSDLLPTADPRSSIAGTFPNMAAVPTFLDRDGADVSTLREASRLCPEGFKQGGGAHYNREDWGQSLGDYDVFLYHLTAGFHIQGEEPEDGVIPYSFTANQDFDEELIDDNSGAGKYYTGAEIDTLYGISGSNDNEWADYFTHYGCQSFVRSSLISRHNNAYQHDAVHDPDSLQRWGAWTNHATDHSLDVHDEWDEKRHYNYYTSFTKRKEWHVRRPEMSLNQFPDPFVTPPGAVAIVETGIIDDYNERYDDFEQQDSSSDTGHHVTYGKTPTTVAGPKKPGEHTGAGAAVINENVFQTGIFSRKGPKGYDWVGRIHMYDSEAPGGGDVWSNDFGAEGNVGNVGIDLSEGSTGEVRNNTYMNPTYNIKIWGEHPLQVEGHPNGIQTSHRNKYWPVRLVGHPNTFWSLCIKVDVWGCSSLAPTIETYPDFDDVKATKKFIRDRIQIFYQPFGETEKIKFSIDYRNYNAS
mgnify:CR=1 FL=1